MLFLLSPAKSLDYETPTPPAVEALATRPAFVDEAAALIDVLKAKSPAEVASLMSLSDPLAQLNVARYGAWRRTFTARNSKPAALAFDGDVYGGLDAKTLRVDDLAWAQDHVVILSGLTNYSRITDYQWGPHRFLVRESSFQAQTVFAVEITVVAGKDDAGVIENI